MKHFLCSFSLAFAMQSFAQDVEAFRDAIKNWDIPKIQTLVDAGVDVNAKHGDHNYTALMFTMEEYYRTTGEIREGVRNARVKSLGYDSTEALKTLASKGVETTKILLAAGADPNARADGLGHTVLIGSAVINNVEIVKLLLDAGADIHAQDNFDGNALMWAAMAGNNETVKLLLAAGADVNARADKGGLFGEPSALTFAAFCHGDVETMKLLLDAGADINVKGGMGTVLAAAASVCKVDVVKFFLEKGVDVNDKSGNALMFAVEKRIKFGEQTEVVKLLLDAGVDVNRQSEIGETALMWAVYEGNIETVKLLLDAGADASIKNKEGKTARDYALENNAAEIAALLDTITKATQKEGSAVLEN